MELICKGGDYVVDKYETAITVLSELLIQKNSNIFLKEYEIKELENKISDLEKYIETLEKN